MLEEHLRELKYTAKVANIEFGQSAGATSFGFAFKSFNQNYFEFFVQAFKEIQNFAPT